MKRLALVLALLMLVSFAPFASAEEAVSGVDFSNGNLAFFKLDPTQRGTSPDYKLELSSYEGKAAVKIAPVANKSPFIGIALDELLTAEDLPKVAYITFDLALSSLDDTFWPLTAIVYQYAGPNADELTASESKIGVQSPDTNPKTVIVPVKSAFAAGADNYIVLKPNQDDGTAYKGKSELYILGIHFLDGDRAELPVYQFAGAAFPESYAYVEEAVATEEYLLSTEIAAGGWNNFGAGVPIEIWNRAVALKVEYTPNADGTSPLDTNPDGGKFVVQVKDDARNNEWNEIAISDPPVEREEGKSLTLALDGFDKVTEVQNVGYGAWDGGDTITAIKLILAKEPEQHFELGLAPYKADWNNFNSTDGTVPLSVWQGATALVVEFDNKEDGTSPFETNPGGSKFVIQVIGGPAEAGWKEVQLSDPLVEIESGKSLKLYLEDFAEVTEVQNVGLGVWDGADTITQMYLIYKPAAEPAEIYLTITSNSVVLRAALTLSRTENFGMVNRGDVVKLLEKADADGTPMLKVETKDGTVGYIPAQYAVSAE
ncbi:MAG: hypothetical protein LBD16_04835 [Oscillospiraceae bacterium]|jgi:hypothetical protein|nr:hypothetical protein [Oscillospiraceae bacterium]